MQLPGKLGTLDFEDWILGLWAGTVQGGANSAYAGVSLIIVDPKDFNLTTGLTHLLTVTTGLFAVGAVTGFFSFLRNKPAPSVKTTEIAVQKVETKPSGAVIETKVEQKVTEPAPSPSNITKEKTP
jgi:hypothetical protein